jgi:hypothetical protein
VTFTHAGGFERTARSPAAAAGEARTVGRTLERREPVGSVRWGRVMEVLRGLSGCGGGARLTCGVGTARGWARVGILMRASAG